MKFEEFEQRVKNFLQSHQRKILNEKGFHPAGVLIPFQNIGGEVHLLLTLRTDKVAKHKNQVAFPGGAFEEKDRDIMDTALRETEEEIGVSRDIIHVWGLFDDYLTISFFKITPVIAEIPYPIELKLQESEIAEVFSVPFDLFLSGDRFEEKLWEKNGRSYPVYYYYFDRYVIWGITAFIINAFVDKVFGFNPATHKFESDDRWKELILKGNFDSNQPHSIPGNETKD